MRKTFLLTNILISGLFLFSQPVSKKPGGKAVSPAETPVKSPLKKYPSLLWEISGNGLKKPSYLFGTMHVSDKLAFHLGDSFYHALKSADVVALETNPESWQDDFSQSIFFRNRRGSGYESMARNNEWDIPNDLMRITSFAIDKYDEAIKAVLAVEPSLVNGMLYRTYGTQLDDFEEDTFLDMYIFQAGKKLGKRLTGVENFEESEKLVIEAYRDMIRDHNKKRKSYDFEGMFTNPRKVEDAYRKGDLDMLDSLEALTVFSDAFQEKFLYKRNEIQANSIDSIIKRSVLFVGVGAAHLPGKRGVIEILRRKGYSLRPVQMDERSSLQKEAIDKMRSSIAVTTQSADDGFYKVNIPGKKFYRFTEWSGMDVAQYADMVNGAYYMVSRIKTNSLSWGHSTDIVLKKVDSLLYENVPGKILKKSVITKNGYKGWEIMNRTRRGDHQRYNIFVTPFEIIVFKMSGNGEYINETTDAQQFFGSIQLREYEEGNWIPYEPPSGGFSVQLPHSPSLLKDKNYGSDRLEYAAFDRKDGNNYLVMKTNLQNYSFLEEDSFELNLMDESYGFSSFIEKLVSRRFTTLNGFPALESKYLHRDGSYSSIKYVIRGPIYYAVIAHYKKENGNVKRFLNSFSITPFIYPEFKLRTDTVMHFTVQSPFYPEPDKKKDDLNELENIYRLAYEDEDDTQGWHSYMGQSEFKFIGNDTMGEKILVTYMSSPKYSFEKDTTRFWKQIVGEEEEDSTFIYKVNKWYDLSNGTKCREMQITDTGSSRLILSKWFYKNGHFFGLTTLTDTLNIKSPFLDKFFSTFSPADTLTGESLFVRKTDQFFKDLFSGDSTVSKKARRLLFQVGFDSLDVPLLEKVIQKLNWESRDYLSVKKYLISQLGTLKDSSIATYLRQLYANIKDTSEFQHAILNALLNQKTRESFITFKDLILQEPPIDDEESYDNRSFEPRVTVRDVFNIPSARNRYIEDEGYSGAWSQLYDTLSLTRNIFPDFLQLMNVDDYKDEVMDLLTVMVDSGFLKASDYESYFSKLYLDAKQLLKKQMAKEEKDNIEKAGKKDKIVSLYPVDEDEAELDEGNSSLEKYAVLLMPFYNRKPGIPVFFEQLLKTKDRQLLYKTFLLLLRNNHSVQDSLFLKYAKLDEYRSDLYGDLRKIKKLDRFPNQYRNQLDIAHSLLIAHAGRYEKKDTLVYIDKLPVTYKGKKGFVYFFKYKAMRDDNFWQIASVGMQPENPAEIDIENDEFTASGERKLETDKPVKEQLQKMLKELIYSKRNSASVFYEARSYSIYKNYLSEIVKSRRYRD